MNQHESLFDRVFGPGSANFWTQKATWQAQKAAWKAQRHAQRAAWKAQRDAQRAAWKAQHDAWRYHNPFAAAWGLFWTVVWIGFLLLLVLSPEFRTSFIQFMLAIPKFVVHALSAIAGRSEI